MDLTISLPGAPHLTVMRKMELYLRRGAEAKIREPTEEAQFGHSVTFSL